MTGAGIPRTWLAAGPTAGLVVAALLAPIAGRMVDRGQGARLLTFGPLFGAAGLALAALAGGNAILWILAFCVVGLGQATTQFETCFALVTRRLGEAARGAIVRITLVAGFSTTLAFPIGDALNRAVGWQGALLAFAALQVFVTMPVNLAGTRALQRRIGRDGVEDGAAEGDRLALRAALRDGAFWTLAAILALVWMNHMVLTTFALPVLMDRGAAHDIAVMLAAALGPAQVAGRLMLVLAGEKLPLRRLTLWVLAGFVASAAALLIGRGVPVLWLLYVLAQGCAAGIASILRPLLAADVLGRAGFGAIWGALSVAPLTAQAFAPIAGALLMGAGGAPLVIAACLAMAAAALALGLLLARRVSDGR